MSLNLSRNAVAMERALGFLADAERALDDCSSCLARDVIVSEAQATEHNRSTVVVVVAGKSSTFKDDLLCVCFRKNKKN